MLLLFSWFKISKTLFKTNADIIIGNVYIPPENSIYKSDEPLNELEQEYLKLSQNDNYFLLNGDFNSRTGKDKDFVEILQYKYI